MLCYKNGLHIKITKGRNFAYGMGGEGRLYKQLFKESDAKYYLVIDYYGEQFVLDCSVDDSKVQDIIIYWEFFIWKKFGIWTKAKKKELYTLFKLLKIKNVCIMVKRGLLKIFIINK